MRQPADCEHSYQRAAMRNRVDTNRGYRYDTMQYFERNSSRRCHLCPLVTQHGKRDSQTAGSRSGHAAHDIRCKNGRKERTAAKIRIEQQFFNHRKALQTYNNTTERIARGYIQHGSS